jgi:DNA ligase-1
MSKKEFVQLAHTLQPNKHSIAACFMSPKLDGVRAIWDGGISRGRPCSQVPWANTEKDHKKINPPVATGLWSRTGKAIQAPGWFLDKMPDFPLDGELWMGMQSWQQLQSCVSADEPDDRWHLVEYKIFDSPAYTRLFEPREVKVRNSYTFDVRPPDWAMKWSSGVKDHWSFELVLRWLRKRFEEHGQVSLVSQTQLPYKPQEAMKLAEEYAATVIDDGGEGIILRRHTGLWTPERSWDILKFKPELDDEGVVVGYFAGKETDKGSKLLGMMGALELEWQGARFKISGFTDHERKLPDAASDWAAANPGSRLPDGYQNATFPVGASVTFKYRELSDDGVPKEARYLRPAGD